MQPHRVLGNDSSQAAARNAARRMVRHKYGEASAMMVLILAMNCTTRNLMMPLGMAADYAAERNVVD